MSVFSARENLRVSLTKERLSKLSNAMNMFCADQKNSSDYEDCRLQCPLAHIDANRPCLLEEIEPYVRKARDHCTRVDIYNYQRKDKE